MRKENPVLVYGDLSFTVADDQKMILAYSRIMDNEEIVVAFNRSDSLQFVNLPVKSDGFFNDILSGNNGSFRSSDKKIIISLMPLSSIVLKKKL